MFAASIAIMYSLLTPAKEPTMSEQWQAAVIEACDNVQTPPQRDMFKEWQDAVIEATSN